MKRRSENCERFFRGRSIFSISRIQGMASSTSYFHQGRRSYLSSRRPQSFCFFFNNAAYHPSAFDFIRRSTDEQTSFARENSKTERRCVFYAISRVLRSNALFVLRSSTSISLRFRFALFSCYEHLEIYARGIAMRRG